MAAKLPRTECPTCGRNVAVRPVTGVAGYYRIGVHNHLTNGATCSSSRFDLELTDAQLAPALPELDVDNTPAEFVTVKAGEALEGHNAPRVYPELPDTLTGGMTVWGQSAGLQVRPGHCDLDESVVALALNYDNATYDPDAQLYLIDADTARCWRDLLNIATARGAL